MTTCKGHVGLFMSIQPMLCIYNAQTMTFFPFIALTLLVGWQEKGIRPVKSWVLVCWWWRFDWSFAWLTVVTTNSITWKMAVKTERETMTLLAFAGGKASVSLNQTHKTDTGKNWPRDLVLRPNIPVYRTLLAHTNQNSNTVSTTWTNTFETISFGLMLCN